MALAALVVVSPASAQTGAEGATLARGQWTGVRNTVVASDSTQHVVRGDTDGNAYAYDPRSAIVLERSNVINNFSAKSAPGVADSSQAFEILGAKNISLRIYTTANDSASAVKYQILFVQVRYGTGTTADSTGAFPQVTLRSPGSAASLAGAVADTVDASTASGAVFGTREAVWNAQAGEFVAKCQPVSVAGQRYFTVALPPPPAGETYMSVRTRVGPVVYVVGNVMNAASKWTMGVRVDVKGTR